MRFVLLFLLGTGVAGAMACDSDDAGDDGDALARDGAPGTTCEEACGGMPDCHCPAPHDLDGDGHTDDVDCDDHDYAAHPGAVEARCNGADEDCDGSDSCPPDEDGDGVAADGDCNDRDPAVNPFAREIQCDGVDNDCSGDDECSSDADGDGEYRIVRSTGEISGDCNDEDASIHHDAVEVYCDRIDQDCERGDCCDNDDDGDGHVCREDCDDDDARAYPGAAIPPPPFCANRDLDCDGRADAVCDVRALPTSAPERAPGVEAVRVSISLGVVPDEGRERARRVARRPVRALIAAPGPASAQTAPADEVLARLRARRVG